MARKNSLRCQEEGTWRVYAYVLLSREMRIFTVIKSSLIEICTLPVSCTFLVSKQSHCVTVYNNGTFKELLDILKI